MPLYKGTVEIASSKLYKGTTEIENVYKGTSLVYEKTVPPVGINFLFAAGGGNGGTGGGGAGGLLTSWGSTQVGGQPLPSTIDMDAISGISYSITVGAATQDTTLIRVNSSDSSQSTIFTANAGGNGGSPGNGGSAQYTAGGGSGGSGGGGAGRGNSNASSVGSAGGGSGTSGQGFNGGGVSFRQGLYGAGGGGATSAGSGNSSSSNNHTSSGYSNGGSGLYSDITGSYVYYSQGGRGGNNATQYPTTTNSGDAGQAGVGILRMTTAIFNGATLTGTYTTNVVGSDTVIIWTGNGTIAFA